MKEENKLKLKQELKYLLPEEIEKEIENNSTALESQNVDIKKLAQQIYIKRGIDYSKLNKGLFNGLGNTLIEY